MKNNKNLVNVLIIVGSVIYGYFYFKSHFGAKPAPPPEPQAEAEAGAGETSAEEGQPEVVTGTATPEGQPPAEGQTAAAPSGAESFPEGEEPPAEEGEEAAVPAGFSYVQRLNNEVLATMPKPEGPLLFMPKADRNPFISDADPEIADQARKAREEETRLAALRKPKVVERAVSKNPVTQLDEMKQKLVLNAIVGDQVVVNGEVIRVGTNVKVPAVGVNGKTYYELVRVTAAKGNRVWFRYGTTGFYKDLK